VASVLVFGYRKERRKRTILLCRGVRARDGLVLEVFWRSFSVMREGRSSNGESMALRLQAMRATHTHRYELGKSFT
jgi:hypothetical protein